MVRSLCQEEGCSSKEIYQEGGQRGYCSKHGGIPKCQEKGCPSKQVFIEGGQRGFCTLHGGIPYCQKEGCPSKQTYNEFHVFINSDFSDVGSLK